VDALNLCAHSNVAAGSTAGLPIPPLLVPRFPNARRRIHLALSLAGRLPTNSILAICRRASSS
jgi:hypothetical protein